MTLKEYQKLIEKLCIERGYNKDSAEEAFLLVSEEIGELAKSIRQNKSRLKNGVHSEKHEIEDEFADVLWLLLALANKLDVDLEEAFQQKEDKYTKRTYV